MSFFRMRLILALILCTTLVSVGSTYFDVLAHKHVLRRELVRHSSWLGASLQPAIEQAVSSGRVDAINEAVQRLQRPDQTLALAVYTPGGAAAGICRTGRCTEGAFLRSGGKSDPEERRSGSLWPQR